MMKFRRDAPALLIGAVVVVITLLSVASNRLFSGLTSSIEQSQLDLMQSIIEFNLRGAESRALARAEMIANLPNIKKLFAAQDREGLLAETKEMFAIQKEKHGVDQAQFHVPPATSFLRLQDPAKFGDDLSSFRPLVVTVNREQVAKKGFAIARSGPAIFGITPFKDLQGKHIGSFEIGIEFGGVLDGIKSAHGLDSALFLVEAPLKEFGKGVSPDIFSDQNRVGKYIRYYSTNTALLQALIVDQDLGSADGGKLTREALGSPYGVILIPIRNGAGDTIGIIAVAKDFTSTRSAEGRSLVWQIFFALFAIVVLSGAILVVIRGKLLRPLGELSARFGALASGDKSLPTLDSPDLCDELSSLSENYEKLLADGGDK